MPTPIKSEKDLVFIVSGGRTGTRFLGDKISSAIEGSFSEHEPDLIDPLDFRSLRRLKDLGIWHGIFGKLTGYTGIRAIGTLRLKGKLSRSASTSRIAKIRKRYHAKINQALIIESNYQWHLACDEICDIWPSAKIALIIRDPRTWISSWLNKGTRWTLTDFPRWIPPGRPTPRSIGDEEWRYAWKQFDTFGRLAWEWRFVYSRLDRYAQQLNNARMFRFEDLFGRESQTHIAGLLRFCAEHSQNTYYVNIPERFTLEKRNESYGSESGWHTWSESRRHLVNALCGPLMQKYGYGNEPEWTLDK
ncbi:MULTISPECIES: hypothetical protein [unclassified Wenzhouxiangella]|uniref:hypothetical protein n=1 Tax=unclassified Wenzhouxiangella TaxID=2613841 RepID=UPI0011C0803F|nr:MULTISPECIES: hypothetical protein [unclassified Wenzhouxiangella]